jgi:hypothetical protein
MAMSRELVTVDHAVAKDQKCRQRIAGQRGREQVEGDRRPGQSLGGWPRPDDRPPEQQAAQEKRGGLDTVPQRRTFRQGEGGRDVPSDDRQRAGQP